MGQKQLLSPWMNRRFRDGLDETGQESTRSFVLDVPKLKCQQHLSTVRGLEKSEHLQLVIAGACRWRLVPAEMGDHWLGVRSASSARSAHSTWQSLWLEVGSNLLLRGCF